MSAEQAGECLSDWQSHIQGGMLSQMNLELKSELGAGNRNFGASVCRWSNPRADGIAYGENVGGEEGGGLGLQVSNTERLWDEEESGKQNEKEVPVGRRRARTVVWQA